MLVSLLRRNVLLFAGGEGGGGGEEHSSAQASLQSSSLGANIDIEQLLVPLSHVILLVELPTNIEPYQLAILRRMNTMGDEDLCQSKVANAQSTKGMTGSSSEHMNSGEWSFHEKDTMKPLEFDRLGSLSIPDIGETSSEELTDENAKGVTVSFFTMINL